MKETLPVFADTFSKIALEVEPTLNISLLFFVQRFVLRHHFEKVFKWQQSDILGTLLTCELRGEQQDQRSPNPVVVGVVCLGRRVGGCSGQEGGQQPASLWEVEKAYENVLAEGGNTWQLVIWSVLGANWSPSVKAAMVVIHYSYDIYQKSHTIVPRELIMC